MTGVSISGVGHWGNSRAKTAIDCGEPLSPLQLLLARSALVEAAAHLTRAPAQVASLPDTAAHRREQIKLQGALANALMHTKGYAATEKASLDQARDASGTHARDKR
jgi:hypothetical protein